MQVDELCVDSSRTRHMCWDELARRSDAIDQTVASWTNVLPVRDDPRSPKFPGFWGIRLGGTHPSAVHLIAFGLLALSDQSGTNRDVFALSFFPPQGLAQSDSHCQRCGSFRDPQNG